MASTPYIKLGWWNENEIEDGFRIYRSESTFGVDDLPPIYATLPPGTTEFIDDDIEGDTQYFYRVSTFYVSSVSGLIEAVSPTIVTQSTMVSFSEIGDGAAGGFYIGNIVRGPADGIYEGTWAIIMGDRASEPSTSLRWRISFGEVNGTGSTWNGLSNTEALFNHGTSTPAGEYCWNLVYAGFDNWYLPAPDELDLAWINRGVNGLSGLLQMRSEYYWTSRQNGGQSAYCQNFSNGNKDSGNKDWSYRVRPVRRIKIA